MRSTYEGMTEKHLRRLSFAFDLCDIQVSERTFGSIYALKDPRSDWCSEAPTDRLRSLHNAATEEMRDY